MIDTAKQPTISAIIIAKNEEAMIANAIETVLWCDEVLVIDNGSDDKTRDIAENMGARVISFSSDSFAQVREKALKYTKTDWIFYLDADERVSPKLSQEILVHMETDQKTALILNRSNVMYGKAIQHGGWQNDLVCRVFLREKLQGWQGEVHESPLFDGQTTTLFTPLIHLTHRNTQDGLVKSADWTAREAKLLFQAQAARVDQVTLLRKPLMEFIRRYIFSRGYQDGQRGLIEAMIQAFNRFLVYTQLWELQQHPSLAHEYQSLEKSIIEEWMEFRKSNKKLV